MRGWRITAERRTRLSRKCQRTSARLSRSPRDKGKLRKELLHMLNRSGNQIFGPGREEDLNRLVQILALLNKNLPARLKNIVLAVVPHRERLHAKCGGYRI